MTRTKQINQTISSTINSANNWQDILSDLYTLDIGNYCLDIFINHEFNGFKDFKSTPVDKLKLITIKFLKIIY